MAWSMLRRVEDTLAYRRIRTWFCERMLWTRRLLFEPATISEYDELL
jgi:hypothetical protein